MKADTTALTYSACHIMLLLVQEHQMDGLIMGTRSQYDVIKQQSLDITLNLSANELKFRANDQWD
jgi:hypothetical protein